MARLPTSSISVEWSDVHRWRVVLVSTMGILAAAGAVVMSGWVSVETRRLVADATGLLAAIGASAAFAWTAWRGAAWQRLWRATMGLALAVWVAGQVHWTWIRAVEHRVTTLTDVENACYLSLPALSLLALVAATGTDWSASSHENRRVARLASALDGIIILVSVLALVWETTYGAQTSLRDGALWTDNSYPLADLALIGVTIFFASILHSMRRMPLSWILAGLIGIGFSDTLYAYALSSGAEIPPVADLGYMCGPALLGTAAIVPDQPLPQHQRHLGQWTLPYLPLVAVCALVTATTALHGQPQAAEVYFLGGVISLVVVRQLLTQRQVALAHQQLAHRATHDQLTGAANRTRLLNELTQALSDLRDQTVGDHPGLAYVDIDQFKELNDTFGHHAGDTVLRTIVVRLRSCIPDTHTIARIGGDEFVVLFAHTPSTPHDLAHQIHSAVRTPLLLNGYSYQPNVSVGYTVLDANDTPDTALARADASMYRTKRA